MAGTPKARARKAHTEAVTKARATYFDLIRPAQIQFERAIEPHRKWLREQLRAADREFADAREKTKAASSA